MIESSASVWRDDPAPLLVIWAVTVIVLPQVGVVGVTARVVPTRSAGFGASIRTATGCTGAEVAVVAGIALGDRLV